MRHWLVKTEPGCYSIDDLAAEKGQTTPWSGVRNYQARNFMRDDMSPGDPVLFYHSITNPGIVGLAEVAGKAYPDPTQWIPEDQHFDPTSPADNPRWYLVDIHFVRKFNTPLTLLQLRALPELDGMELLRKGSCLSVMPVEAEHFKRVMQLVG